MRWQFFGEREDGAVEAFPGEAMEPSPDSDAAFWASPVGHAARARLRGDRFFQIELDGAALSEYAETSAGARGRRARRTCDLLGQIEELGWQLEHVTWWHVDLQGPGAGDGPAPPAPGTDHVRGVYLFHSAQSENVDGPAHAAVSHASAHAPAHAPTHRRDVS
jgi:hypothetical protein